MIILRDYQEEQIAQLRNAYKSGYKAPLIVARTGSGKTVMFSYIAQHAKGNVLILVHRQELLSQSSATLSKLGVEHGLVSPAHPLTSHKVQVASVQTVVRRIDKIPVPDLIIIDECHHATRGSTWGKVISAFPGVRLLGVTATPIRLDGRGLGDVFDTMIQGASFERLVGDAHLVRPYIYSTPQQFDLSEIKCVAGDYNQGQLDELIDKASITGDAVSHYKKYADGKAGVVFCVSIKHAQHVAESFRSEGYRAQCIHGNMKREERAAAIKALTVGELQLLTACDIISEGTDIPRIEVAILLRPTKSLSLCLQQIGRALRPYPGKEVAIVLDHVGNVMRHGLPDDEIEWSLKPNRKKTKKSPPTLSTCGKCYFTYRTKPGKTKTCPECGFFEEVTGSTREIEQIDGELQAVNREMLLKQQKSNDYYNIKTVEDAINHGKKYGYRAGWAHRPEHRWNRRRSNDSECSESSSL